MPESLKEAVRNQENATIIGAELQGDAGFCCAPKVRTYALAKLTMLLARIGWTTPKALRVLLGSWVSTFLFRRPLLSSSTHSFRAIETDSGVEVMCLSGTVKNELLMAALLCPLAVSDLRAPYPEVAFCFYASSFAGGYVGSYLPQSTSVKAWRLKERRGAYRHLETGSEVVGRKLAAVECWCRKVSARRPLALLFSISCV